MIAPGQIAFKRIPFPAQSPDGAFTRTYLATANLDAA